MHFTGTRSFALDFAVVEAQKCEARKLDVIAITNKRNNLIHKYNIHGTERQTVKDDRYLRVTLGFDLSWSKHVDDKSRRPQQD